jgi:hypothetical protein
MRATKLTVVSKNGVLYTNDHSHGAHGPDNPDTGETSEAAIELAAALLKQGVIATVERIEE